MKRIKKHASDESFWNLYHDDMEQRLRENTIRTKRFILIHDDIQY